ncbi:MAG: hypothetical protein ACI36Z_03130 [Alloprevotella sp.]
MEEPKMNNLQESRNITALLACEKRVQYEFCKWAEQYGASSSTLRDVLLLGYRDMDPWKITGIEKLVRSFNPDYQGDIANYYETVGLSEKFYEYIRDKGGMCRTSTWARFRNGWFKPWELIGLEDLAGRFLKTKR